MQKESRVASPLQVDIGESMQMAEIICSLINTQNRQPTRKLLPLRCFCLRSYSYYYICIPDLFVSRASSRELTHIL